MLPLCDSPRREDLEHLLFDHPDFLRIADRWIFMPMQRDQNVEVFMAAGKELQRSLDEGAYVDPKDKKQFEIWKAMKFQFGEQPF